MGTLMGRSQLFPAGLCTPNLVPPVFSPQRAQQVLAQAWGAQWVAPFLGRTISRLKPSRAPGSSVKWPWVSMSAPAPLTVRTETLLRFWEACFFISEVDWR